MPSTECAETAFSTSRDRFEQVCSFLGEQQAAELTHSELEERLSIDLRELVRQLFQDHLWTCVRCARRAGTR